MEDITLLSLLSLIFGFILLIIKNIYKSKCIECDIFGFKIKRDVKIEVEKEKYDIEHNIKSNNDISELNNNLKNVIK
jgi:hypothetical protein